MRKIRPISLQLNFTPNTLGGYGLKKEKGYKKDAGYTIFFYVKAASQGSVIFFFLLQFCERF